MTPQEISNLEQALTLSFQGAVERLLEGENVTAVKIPVVHFDVRGETIEVQLIATTDKDLFMDDGEIRENVA